ncbi:DUF2218 domain-containing protein [Microbispora bryophytorum]|uniref:DUF2218 domain-containing protein n=1 Tax=Microbispora bryophytorum subsp. camponoti TaxID=1677852 RepID=A0ABR8KU31_9ACTN|nr:DUF2218 domain-containing protein [Microbispora camponoti]MBD3142274.1 DUF2218 domain-containing protein [Microbispora camponoti]
MPHSTAYVVTDRPERYIKQLVSHMDHKVEAVLGGDGRAVIELGSARCVLRPRRGGLEMIATAAGEEPLAGVRDVVTRHLLRFAAQEELVVDWSPPVGGDAAWTLSPVVDDYLLTHCSPADEVLRDLVVRTREETAGAAGMQVSHDEGALLTMLARMSGARLAVEVGVFTGYSSICIARGLPAGGRLLACDVSTEWTSIARNYWERAGVADRIDLRIAPALETLRALPAEPVIGFAFIDADKESYPDYYEEVVTRLSPGGLVVVDNVFQGGRVFDPAFQGDAQVAVRRLNETIARDERVESVMLPVRDGVTIARRVG